MTRLRAADAARRRDSAHGRDFLEALARGLAIMGTFSADRRAMTLSEAARAVELPRATVRRTLHTLAILGYVESDGRLFRLTPQILKLASTYLVSNGISTILQPVCERLCRELNEACSAAVLDGDEVVMIAHASPPRFVAVGPGVGFRLPAFCTSLGRVLLAALADDALDDCLARLKPSKLTPHTVTSRNGLRAAVLSARKQGFALADQEAEEGFRSVAVPVRRYDGLTVAAINIGARVERATLEKMREDYAPRLVAEAAILRDQLM